MNLINVLMDDRQAIIAEAVAYLCDTAEWLDSLDAAAPVTADADGPETASQSARPGDGAKP